MRSIAILLVLGACFPHNAKHRRYAKIGEGAVIVTGIAMQFAAGSCMEARPGTLGEDCEDGQLDSIGLGLIFAGLAGFAATMITSPETERRRPPEIDTYHHSPPRAFCAALWANDREKALAAVRTYLRSIGMQNAFDALDAVHAWLWRQPCVIPGEVDHDVHAIRFAVPGRADYVIVTTVAPDVELVMSRTFE